VHGRGNWVNLCGSFDGENAVLGYFGKRREKKKGL
jgi:hypothetical protein